LLPSGVEWDLVFAHRPLSAIFLAAQRTISTFSAGKEIRSHDDLLAEYKAFGEGTGLQENAKKVCESVEAQCSDGT